MKKIYKSPEILKVDLDYSISLIMQSAPGNPTPRNAVGKGAEQSKPFSSPFEQKPLH
jgi:hypothetical protein